MKNQNITNNNAASSLIVTKKCFSVGENKIQGNTKGVYIERK